MFYENKDKLGSLVWLWEKEIIGSLVWLWEKNRLRTYGYEIRTWLGKQKIDKKRREKIRTEKCIGKGRYLKKSLNTVRRTGKDLSLCHKYKFLIPKLLEPDGVISNKIIWSNRTPILKYLRSKTLGCYDVWWV